MTLTYKSTGGENYPVLPGQVWRVGSHLIRCGDLMNARDLDWLGSFSPQLIYCDPPWGQALATAARTKAGLSDYVSSRDLFVRVFEWIATLRPTMPVYFEQGRKWVKEMQQFAVDAGLEVEQEWAITYDRKVPATLTLFNFNGYKTNYGDLTGIDDTVTPLRAIEFATRQGTNAIVMDPMTGRGQTAVSAAQAGRTFVGMELSPHRVSVTLTKLAKVTGKEPIRE